MHYKQRRYPVILTKKHGTNFIYADCTSRRILEYRIQLTIPRDVITISCDLINTFTCEPDIAALPFSVEVGSGEF